MTKENMNHFWTSFNSSRCKTTIMVITFIITIAFCFDQTLGSQNQNLATGFFALMTYWIGRSTKAIENKTEI